MKRRTLLALVVLAAGCASSQGGPVYEQGVDIETARRVHERHGRQLERDYPRLAGHAVGVVTRERKGPLVYGIVVYLADEADLPGERRFIEGVPVAFTVTGEFSAR